jgi:superoxide dismutase, Cu-Zn family
MMMMTIKPKFISASFVAALILMQGSTAFAQLIEALDLLVIGNDGKEIGSAELRSGGTGIVMRIELNAGALTPGWHGMHFHAVGDCSDTDKFKNSKAHVNHTGAPHGLLNPRGPEAGDLPNLWAAADGSANAEIASPLVGLTQGANALRDSDGSALIIHAREDDHWSQPIGNAGDRTSCALIK